MIFSKLKKISIFLIFYIVAFLVLPIFVFSENLEKKCLELAEKGCQSLSSTECKKELEACEEFYKKESEKIEKDLTKTAQEKKTLQNEIWRLSKKIKNLNYQIYQSSLVIKDLGIQIKDTTGSIKKTSEKIEDSRKKLKVILRTIYEEDQKPLVEILLSSDDISDFFDNLVALEILNKRNKELLDDIKILKNNLENQKKALDEEKEELERMLEIQTLQKEESARTKSEHEYYLKITEKEYQKKLQKKEELAKRAAEIRARIFELVGVPKAPTFGEAYEIAKYVEKVTGVRPAFLLAILTQESNIGKNVGQCYLKDPKTGTGVLAYNGKTISRVMKPSRDVPHFLAITKELGRDPYKTPVSCPMSYGWGGAMGPAQFIPSTWARYKDRVKKITGRPADPWNIRDAFLAAALYLADYGATKQTYNSEWKAAMIYFSGTTNKKYRFYGDSVMRIASRYEKDIEDLEAAK